MSCVLGLTGMTGAGKSTVAGFFRENGAKIVDADMIARQAILDENVKKKLAETFGSDILGKDGQIVRACLAEKAFANENSAKKLSAITHPFILKIMQRRIDEYKSCGTDIIIVDAPLLYQSGADGMCDKVIFVSADEKTRLKRITARDKISEKQAKKRTDVQEDMKRYEKHADFIIENNGDLKELYFKCSKIIERIC